MKIPKEVIRASAVNHSLKNGNTVVNIGSTLPIRKPVEEAPKSEPLCFLMLFPLSILEVTFGEEWGELIQCPFGNIKQFRLYPYQNPALSVAPPLGRLGCWRLGNRPTWTRMSTKM